VEASVQPITLTVGVGVVSMGSVGGAVVGVSSVVVTLVILATSHISHLSVMVIQPCPVLGLLLVLILFPFNRQQLKERHEITAQHIENLRRKLPQRGITQVNTHSGLAGAAPKRPPVTDVDYDDLGLVGSGIVFTTDD
jgi:hypothetical protein